MCNEGFIDTRVFLLISMIHEIDVKVIDDVKRVLHVQVHTWYFCIHLFHENYLESLFKLEKKISTCIGQKHFIIQLVLILSTNVRTEALKYWNFKSHVIVLDCVII